MTEKDGMNGALLESEIRYVNSIIWSPNGKYFAALGDGKLVIYDVMESPGIELNAFKR